MIYVISDTHGQLDGFRQKPLRSLKKTDTVVVLGDFGFLWDDSREEQKARKWLESRRYRILFLDGCHDNYDMLREYPKMDYLGGKARHIGGNLYYICRGSILTVEGKKLLCFGGGETFDKEDREEGVNWWRAEMPTMDELEWCVRNLQAAGRRVDYILTHDAPTQLLDFTTIKGHDFQGNWLHTFFDKLIANTEYRGWLFGRYHHDQALSTKARAVFCIPVALEDEKFGSLSEMAAQEIPDVAPKRENAVPESEPGESAPAETESAVAKPAAEEEKEPAGEEKTGEKPKRWSLFRKKK